MSKFNKDGSREMPELNTSSLPDLIFTILFFFMVVTSMREVSLLVEITVPSATELVKLEKKSLVSYIYIGKPNRAMVSRYGTEPRIQLNDKFAETPEIRNFIAAEKASLKESDQPLMTVSIRADHNTDMGIITDVKEALREANALKINYSAAMRDNAPKY